MSDNPGTKKIGKHMRAVHVSAGEANELARGRASEAKLAAARASFEAELDRLGDDPEPEGDSPMAVIIAVAACVLGAAALAWGLA